GDVSEMVSEKESRRRILEKDNLKVEAKSEDQVVPKRHCRRKEKAKEKQTKESFASQRRNKPEVSAQDETEKRKRRHNGAMNQKRFICKLSVKTFENVTTCWKRSCPLIQTHTP
ncbi:UNVERIFIED_CONTAM: hypothetical protein K2H54_062707, partial [Gekko kuhli]